MLKAWRHGIRLCVIARTLGRFDALFLLDLLGDPPLAVKLARLFARLLAGLRLPGDGGLDEKAGDGGETPVDEGERLARALEFLGPSFIKFGQGLATRPDLVGDRVARHLGKLQDSLAPFPAAEARATIKSQLGRPVDVLFTSFEDQPVAAASIAQVHFAVTTEGEDVAVKVLRPGVEEAFGRDVETFLWLAGLIERTQPAARRLRPVAVLETVSRTVRNEMDLRMEAAAASELAANMADDRGYAVPTVDWQRCGRRVLVTGRVDGLPVTDRQPLVDAGHDLPGLARRAVQAFLVQALRDGFFHADMHQGNLFVDAAGTLVAVDFGIMGRLDKESRRYLAEILYGFQTADYGLVADVHFEAGYVPADQSRDDFAMALRAVAEPIFGRPARDISLAALLGHLFQVTERFAMRTQPQLILLQKTMVMVEGVARHLDPDFNMWEVSRPVIERWMVLSLSPEGQLREVADAARALTRRLPAVLRRLEEESRYFVARPANRSAAGETPPAPPASSMMPWGGWVVAIAGLAGLIIGLLL